MLEEERDTLARGLAVVEQARRWYYERIHTVEDKLRHLPSTNTQHVSLTCIPQEFPLPLNIEPLSSKPTYHVVCNMIFVDRA